MCVLCMLLTTATIRAEFASRFPRLFLPWLKLNSPLLLSLPLSMAVALLVQLDKCI